MPSDSYSSSRARSDKRKQGPSILPVLDLQPRHPPEFPGVARHDRGAETLRLSCDQCIHWPDSGSTGLKVVADRRVVRAVIPRERLNWKRLRQLRELEPGVGIRTLGHAE